MSSGILRPPPPLACPSRSPAQQVTLWGIEEAGSWPVAHNAGEVLGVSTCRCVRVLQAHGVAHLMHHVGQRQATAVKIAHI